MAGPKKITPYLLFSTESREKAKQQLIDAGDPKPGMGDIAKTVGVMWHALGDDGKEAYKTRAEEENAKAAAAYAAAVESGEVDEDADAENDRDAGEPDVALPLARVKRIMKLDKEVKNCANDACRTITRATELFIESLVEGAFVSMRAQKRKTIKHGDVEHHVLRKPRLEFLGDHVWASRPRGPETQAAASLRAGGASEADKENKESADGTAGPEETVTPPRIAPEAPAGARQVTDFFRAERRAGADGDENDAPAGAGEDAATE